MEELSKQHKDVPFGWALSLQRMLTRGPSHRVDQSRAPWRQEEPRTHLLPDDLHNLAAPR
ncbi:MAG TPA: hypothetical protein VFW47_14520 [Phenylobacterium sp.]|nr:hypothetical protein [Phenylobacterium sp.]